MHWTNEKNEEYFQLENLVNIISRITLSDQQATNHMWLFKFNLKLLENFYKIVKSVPQLL